jgi:CHC2 zinc finger
MRYVTPEVVKARAPLRPLCAALGISIGQDDYALCPFHEDNRPSFYIWQGEDGLDRWWCQPCGIGGDQIALIRKVRGLSFSAALIEIDEIADKLPEWEPVVRRARDPERDMRELIEVVSSAMGRAKQPELDGYISLYAIPYVVESDGRPDDRFIWDAHLRGLGWGVDDVGRVIFPYWTADGQLVGAKKRSPDGSRAAVYGSRFPALYLSWQPRAQPSVVLCEGETDCGWAAFHARGRLDVRGIPRGAGAPADDEFVRDLMWWETIYLGLDPDSAGERATARWLEALTNAGHADVRIFRLPPGHDLRRARIPLERLTAEAVHSLP